MESQLLLESGAASLPSAPSPSSSSAALPSSSSAHPPIRPSSCPCWSSARRILLVCSIPSASADSPCSGSPLPLKEMSELLSKELAIAGAAARSACRPLPLSSSIPPTRTLRPDRGRGSSRFIVLSLSYLFYSLSPHLRSSQRRVPSCSWSRRSYPPRQGCRRCLKSLGGERGRESHVSQQVEIVHELEELHAHPHSLCHRLLASNLRATREEATKQESRWREETGDRGAEGAKECGDEGGGEETGEEG